MKGRSIPYSAIELSYIQSVSKWTRAEAHAAFCQKFQRDDVTLPNFHALCKRNGWSTGRTGCFEKGQEPVNKGKKCKPGRGGNHPNARKTQFTPGERRGVAVRLYKPVGTERMAKDGYLERKIHDGLPLRSRWRAVHLVRWEALNGPVPKGYALKCLDGDRLNTAPANWEAVPRAILPRLAGGNRYHRKLAYDDAPAELRPTILVIAKPEHAMRRRPVGSADAPPTNLQFKSEGESDG
jgi:hypothetical protein